VIYNFQNGNNKSKLRTEYERVTQNVLFGNAVLATMMTGRKYKQFYFVLSGLKIVGHGIPNSNLESPYVLVDNIQRKNSGLHLH
jgi:hypothetical protein